MKHLPPANNAMQLAMERASTVNSAALRAQSELLRSLSRYHRQQSAEKLKQMRMLRVMSQLSYDDVETRLEVMEECAPEPYVPIEELIFQSVQDNRPLSIRMDQDVFSADEPVAKRSSMSGS